MSTRLLIDEGHRLEWFDTYDGIAPRDGTVAEVVGRAAWKLPQKVYCATVSDAMAFLWVVEDVPDYQAPLAPMPLDEYALYLWTGEAGRSWRSIGTDEAWQARRDLARCLGFEEPA